MAEISQEVSRKLGNDFTDGAPSVVYAMAKKSGKVSSSCKITSFKCKAVKNTQCEVGIVTCRGDLCEMHSMVYPLRPPLKSAEEFSSRIPQIRNDVCSPKWYWLFTNPLALIILVTCSALAYGALVLGTNGIVDALMLAPNLEGGVETIFGSTKMFANVVWAAFYFAVIAHGIEAIMAFNICKNVLKLNSGTTALWSFMIFLVGYPIFNELKELAEVEQSHIKSK